MLKLHINKNTPRYTHYGRNFAKAYFKVHNIPYKEIDDDREYLEKDGVEYDMEEMDREGIINLSTYSLL